MLKTYTLVRKEEIQVSDTVGKMIFHLKDENGEQRTVSGITKLDVDLNAVSISTDKKREYPLIECLFYSEVDETINIEFKQYNTVFERKDNEASEKTVEEIAKEMQSKPMRVGSLIKTTEVKTTDNIH